MRVRTLLTAATLLASVAALVPVANGLSSGSGIRELRTQSLVAGISADGARVAVNRYVGINCDAISIWSPFAGSDRRIKRTGFCDDGGDSDQVTLAGPRLLWEDGIAANTYSDVTVFTLDTRRRRAVPIHSYEWFHDDRGDYGPGATYAGHGSLLVAATSTISVQGKVTRSRLWRVDGRHLHLIRRFAPDLSSVSVDGGRIAVAEDGGPVLLLATDGHTIRAFHPALRRVRIVVLQGNEMVAAGGGKLVAFDARSGRVEVSRSLPAESRLEDYANGLATLIHGNSIHVFRVSDGKDVVVARPHGPGIFSAYIDAQIEPAGLFYTYTTETSCCQTGHVVFVPWKTLEQELR